MMNIEARTFTISAIDSKLFCPDLAVDECGITTRYALTSADVVIDHFHAECRQKALEIARDFSPEKYDISDILVFMSLASAEPTIICCSDSVIFRFDAAIGEIN